MTNPEQIVGYDRTTLANSYAVRTGRDLSHIAYSIGFNLGRAR
ncbi:hypothetical protein [Bradyrhizobium vignae]|nr:hypothetical protein [Bradyrhizobium vignae]